MRVLPLPGNLGFLGANLPGTLRFRRALGRVKDTQTEILKGYLERNGDTVFGRRFGFRDIRSVQDYQDQVPVTTYEDYSVYVDRVSAGEQGVLTGEPVTLLEWSSGSTSGAKLIPFTTSLQAEFLRAVGPWVADTFLKTPSLAMGPAYWSISPAYQPPEAGGTAIPVGFLDDRQYLGGRLASLVAATFAVPGSVAEIADPDLHRRVTLLFLLGCRDLRMVSVWHPSFLTVLMTSLFSSWTDLLQDLSQGIRIDSLGLNVPPNPQRATELEGSEPMRLGAVWPHLGLISCWTDGPAARAIPALMKLFPGVAIQGKGLMATEGVVTIPFDGGRPLAVRSHFFEFLNEDGTALPAWEIEEEGLYSVLLTTGGGLVPVPASR